MTEPRQHAIHPRSGPSPVAAWLILGLIFAAVQFAALFRPPLLDDVDATHAEAAQHMAETGDLVTLYVNGVRYLEKPPLPYWLTAADYRIFGQNVFATHLPNALAILGCAWICWLWAGTRLGPASRILRRPGHAHRHWAVPVHPLRHSRRTPHLPLVAGAVEFPHRSRGPARAANLRHVGGSGPGHAGQRAGGPGLFHCRRSSIPDAERPVASLARAEACHRRPALPGSCRAVAHPGRPGQPRPGPSPGQSPHSGKCSRILVLLLHQRACAALPGRPVPE